MFSSSWSLCHLAVLLFGLLGLVSHVSTADIAYCSDFNTAVTNRNNSIYQSNGLCSIFCRQDYAFAVLQYDSCWCSNYAPQVNTSGCSRKCPGYPTELCGGVGLYGYIKLDIQPSGTKGASSTTAKPAPTTVTESLDPVTTTVVIPPIVISITELSRSLPSTTSKPADTTDPPSSSGTWVPTPIVSLETITGQVRTVTITPTSPPNAESANESRPRKASGLGVGGAVGLAIGLLALLAIIGAIVFLCLRRRRRQEKEAELADSSRESIGGVGGPIPTRTMSENSRYVLGTDGRQVVETWENQNAPGTRTSRLMPVDPRLDPFSPVYQRGENKSRESVNTIRDDHDYSRRVHGSGNILRATNPDE